MCAENVDRLWPIDCSSPMSASTASNRSTRAPAAAGTWSPARTNSTASAAAFIATVLPPALGPEITSTDSSPPSRMSFGTAWRGSRHGMAQLRKPEHSRVADLGRRRIELDRELGAREREVEQRERVEARIDLGRGGRGRVGELAQHARDLALHLELGALVLVVELDERLRLDEQRGSRTRGVVHDAADLAAAVGAHRQHIAVVAHGEVVVRERAADVRVAQDPREAIGEARGELVGLAARGGQRGGGLVADPALRVETARDLALELGVLGQELREIGEPRRRVRALADEAARLAQPRERLRDPDQLLARERPAAARAPERLRGIARAAERRAVARLEDRARLRGEREALARRLGGRREQIRAVGAPKATRRRAACARTRRAGLESEASRGVRGSSARP